MTALRKIVQSAGFYPITALYLVGVGLILLLVQGLIDLKTTMAILGFAAVSALLFAAWRELQKGREELTKVHQLVNSQRSEMIARIDELSALLTASGVVVPPIGEREADARDDQRRSRSGK